MTQPLFMRRIWAWRAEVEAEAKQPTQAVRVDRVMPRYTAQEWERCQELGTLPTTPYELAQRDTGNVVALDDYRIEPDPAA